LIGSQLPGRPLLQTYYWIVLLLLAGGVVFFACRFFRERFEIQQLVLTVLGFLAFQIAFFFLREPLSTWPRYFILYLPYIVLLIPLTISRILSRWSVLLVRRNWVTFGALLIIASSGFAQIRNNYRNPYVDHGPDFRQVYEYLITRVSPRDKIVVGLATNRMALNYYWPAADQMQLRYEMLPSDKNSPHPSIWTVSYQDADSQAFRDYARALEHMDYRLGPTRVVSKVTIRQFIRGQTGATPKPKENAPSGASPDG
jgi:hypothetical protein